MFLGQEMELVKRERGGGGGLCMHCNDVAHWSQLLRTANRLNSPTQSPIQSNYTFSLFQHNLRLV